METGFCLSSCRGHEGDITDLAVSSNNALVASASNDCIIRVWRLPDGLPISVLRGHTGAVTAIAFSPRPGCEHHLLSWSEEVTNQPNHELDTLSGHENDVNYVQFSGSAVPARIFSADSTKEENLPKFKNSCDGTSIVLSDEVGQIYILATGQGESQKDAKYDQFFLGDYRPLIQDVHGNVLDQETQLPPYRRNIQDLLCDANMIPYPDPYQNMYQQRRLGALGIDWQPPSVRLAVGTIDDGIYAIQDDLFGQLPPTNGEGDRDRWLEQPAELEDGMDWEQENDAQSDDTGSEYNVTDECTSEGEKGSLNVSSSEESRIPLPLSVDLIKRRLLKYYYRTFEAFEHDFHVMLANAQYYFGKEDYIYHLDILKWNPSYILNYYLWVGMAYSWFE